MSTEGPHDPREGEEDTGSGASYSENALSGHVVVFDRHGVNMSYRVPEAICDALVSIAASAGTVQ